MIVSARTMNVSVVDFFFTGVAHIHNLYIKMQCLAGERVIAVNGNFIIGDVGNRDQGFTAIGAGMKPHSDFEFIRTFKTVTRYFLYEFVHSLPVGIFRGNGDLELIARALAFQRLLETRNQIARTMQVGKRILTLGCIKYIAGIIG